MVSEEAIYMFFAAATIIMIYTAYTLWTRSSKLLTFQDCSSTAYIKGALIANPSSTNFAYGGWFYVSNFGTTSGIKNLFRRNGNTGQLTTNVYLDSTSGVLCVQICDGRPTPTNVTNKVVVTKSYPMQKWVNIVVSVDGGNTCDVYLDGKMASTFILGTRLNSQPGSEMGIECGPFDGYVANFKTWTTSVDPNTVWNYYLQGSGRGASALGLADSYGLSMQVTKNGDVAQTLKVV